ncbi:hypothetical protein A2U01_0110159, partial [Trifolium medium]|nr:hypothetical protein [Trifolium medium]
MTVHARVEHAVASRQGVEDNKSLSEQIPAKRIPVFSPAEMGSLTVEDKVP